jgi:hypothetical protein
MYEALKRDITRSSGPQFLPMDDTKNYFHLDNGGNIELWRAKPGHRQHQARSLETIALFADRFASEADETVGSAIWYSRDGVVCLIDDEDRRDRVTLKLDLSEQILKLVKLVERPWFEQRAFLTLLRTVFKGAFDQDHPNLIDQLRRIQSTQQSDGAAEIQRGKSSIGKAIRAEVTGVGDVPEYVVLRVPVFHQRIGVSSFPVECCLELDETALPVKFQLLPLPGMIERAITDAEQQLQELLHRSLDGDQVPLYYGTP